MSMNKKIIKILKPCHVDYIGFADITSYQEELMRYGGGITAGYANAISIGIAIPDSIVDHLPQRNDVNVSCEYKIHGYDVLNQRLNMIASTLSSYLNQRNYMTLPIAVADRTDEENALPTVSHKMIAHIAGLGWIGKNCLLITKRHGPRVRFISLLTDAPVKTANSPLEQQCHDCEECVKACPVRAIRGKNFVMGEEREERFDFLKCQKYFDALKRSRPFAVCGMCLYACPYGKKNSSKPSAG